jgi:hypothetical protein
MPLDKGFADRLRRALNLEPGRRFHRVLNVPTLGTGSTYSLFRLRQEMSKELLLHGTDVDFEFDFTNCRFLGEQAVAFLGGMMRLIEYQGAGATISEHTLRPDVRRNLLKNGFLEVFAKQGGRAAGNTIPFRQHRAGDDERVVEYLVWQWLGRDWVRASVQLTSAIVGKMWEIYANAFEHSRSPIGVFSCGQHYPNVHKLNLCVIDFGVGIPYNVRQHMQSRRLTAESALEWAFQEGTTTSQDGIARDLAVR